MCHKKTWYVIIRLNGKVPECPLWREQGSTRGGHKIMEHEKVVRARIVLKSPGNLRCAITLYPPLVLAKSKAFGPSSRVSNLMVTTVA
jgi:hypothetical protein